jgi:hypothetical protein
MCISYIYISTIVNGLSDHDAQLLTLKGCGITQNVPAMWYRADV